MAKEKSFEEDVYDKAYEIDSQLEYLGSMILGRVDESTPELSTLKSQRLQLVGQARQSLGALMALMNP